VKKSRASVRPLPRRAGPHWLSAARGPAHHPRCPTLRVPPPLPRTAYSTITEVRSLTPSSEVGLSRRRHIFAADLGVEDGRMSGCNEHRVRDLPTGRGCAALPPDPRARPPPRPGETLRALAATRISWALKQTANPRSVATDRSGRTSFASLPVQREGTTATPTEMRQRCVSSFAGSTTRGEDSVAFHCGAWASFRSSSADAIDKERSSSDLSSAQARRRSRRRALWRRGSDLGESAGVRAELIDSDDPRLAKRLEKFPTPLPYEGLRVIGDKHVAPLSRVSL
jgi:hypothetical protein